MRSVGAVDIKGRVSFGVAQCLRFFEHVGEVAPFLRHFTQDVVTGAVDDAGDAFDFVTAHAFAQDFDDRDAACNRRFKGKLQSFFAGQGEEGIAVAGDEGFVGGDDVFVVFEGGFDNFKGGMFAASQLDDDADIRVAGDSKGVGVAGKGQGAGVNALPAAFCDAFDL